MIPTLSLAGINIARHRSTKCGSEVCKANLPCGSVNMLFLVFLLLALWFFGLVTSYTVGGLLHILLVIALVLFLIHIIQGSSIGEA